MRCRMKISETTGLVRISIVITLLYSTLVLIAITGNANRRIDLSGQPEASTIHWSGVSNGVYEVQDRHSLTQGEWNALDSMVGIDGLMSYPVEPDYSPSRFFRVLFPQPRLRAVEPAYIPSGQSSTLYITGEFFYEGDVVSMGGTVLSNVSFLHSGLLQVDVVPPSAGTYEFELVSSHDGSVLTTLPAALQVDPPLHVQLQGPPTWPPAGPAMALPRVDGHVTVLKAFEDDFGTESAPMSKKGYDHYMANSSSSVAGRKKGYDYYMAKSDMSAATVPGGGHVTVLKARDLDPGHVTVLKARGAAINPGHVTVLKNRDNDCNGVAYVQPYSGEVLLQTIDLYIPGRGLDFIWVRTYRSRTGQNTVMGNRWSHSYDVRCVQNGQDMDVYDGTGRIDTYRLQADGSYTCPGQFREGSLTGQVYRLTFADSGFWEFYPFNGSPEEGKLSRIEDRNGNALTLQYDLSGRLDSITDTLGRTHSIFYNPMGMISSVRAIDNRSILYTYFETAQPDGNSNDLHTVTSPAVIGTPTGNDFPSGKTTTFTYTTGRPDDSANHLLSTVTDPKGQLRSQFTYELDNASPAYLRCTGSQEGPLTATRYSYAILVPAVQNGYAARSCIINDPVGNVREIRYDTRNRGVWSRGYTGRAVPGTVVTDTSKLAYPQLRSYDPVYYEVTYIWNNDSLCTGIQMADGTKARFTYEGDVNPTARVRRRPDLLLSEWDTLLADPGGDLDGDGQPDIVVMSTSYEHDPRFGTRVTMRIPPSINGLEVTAPGVYPVNDPPTVCGTTEHFITAATDPLGTTTRATYDGDGNLTSAFVDVEDGPQVDFVYDQYGQATNITRAADALGRRRMDTFSWQNGRLYQSVRDAAPGGTAITTTIERDTYGNPSRIIDPRGNDTLIVCNELNQPVSVSLALQSPNRSGKDRNAILLRRKQQSCKCCHRQSRQPGFTMTKKSRSGDVRLHTTAQTARFCWHMKQPMSCNRHQA